MSSFALRLPPSETYLRATNTNKASSVASMHPVLAGCSVVMSDHGQVRQIHVTPVTEATLTPLLLIKIHDILSRASDGWLVLTGSTVPLSLEALRDVVCRGFGPRLLAVTCQWKSGIPAETTGLVTCGPHSLGAAQWRIATVFAPEHHVPLTLSVLQLASRFWYATLPGGWPRSLSWRMLQRSVESRRILETVLVFHAMGGNSTREFWASVAAVSSSKLVAPLGEVSFGAYGGQLLSDLATWGTGVARWSVHRVSELEAVGVLAAGTVGHVLHAAALPIASRGFQHLGPSKREELLGAHVSSILDNIAVSPRAAQERIRTTVSPLPQAETSPQDAIVDEALLPAIAWPMYPMSPSLLHDVRVTFAVPPEEPILDLRTPEHRCTTQPSTPSVTAVPALATTALTCADVSEDASGAFVPTPSVSPRPPISTPPDAQYIPRDAPSVVL